MATDRLFRQEALDARATRWLGSIRIAQPLGDGLVALLAVVVVATLAAFAIFGSYTRRATVPGLLEPVGGTVRMTASSGGAVLAVPANEGREVASGDVLFVLSNERVSSSGATAAAVALQLVARRATLERDLELSGERHASRVRGSRERLAAIDLERTRLDQEAMINASRLRIAQVNIERYEALAATGFVSTLQVQAKVDDLLVLEAQAAGLGRTDAALARERGGLATQLVDSRLQADAERGDIRRALAAVEQERSENEARRTTLVTAPHDATVTGIAVHAGQSVAAGALLATLIPTHAPLEAELYASTRQVGFVERGQRVRLRYAAYPYQKFGMGEGTVVLIEQSPYAPQELPSQVRATLGANATQGADPVYRIVVRLDAQSMVAYGHPQPLRSGMVFEADVLQDRRRLFEWLLEPIYGLAGR